MAPDRQTLVLHAVLLFIYFTNKYSIFYYSILDQQQKQAIPFQGGVVLNDYDGRLFIASPKAIYSMVPIAWEKQVEF